MKNIMVKNLKAGDLVKGFDGISIIVEKEELKESESMKGVFFRIVYYNLEDEKSKTIIPRDGSQICHLISRK